MICISGICEHKDIHSLPFLNFLTLYMTNKLKQQNNGFLYAIFWNMGNGIIPIHFKCKQYEKLIFENFLPLFYQNLYILLYAYDLKGA